MEIFTDLSNNSTDAIQGTNTCIHCGKKNIITLDRKSIEKWQNGDFIQDAFPYLNADERELIQTGTHVECWNKMFPE